MVLVGLVGSAHQPAVGGTVSTPVRAPCLGSLEFLYCTGTSYLLQCYYRYAYLA